VIERQRPGETGWKERRISPKGFTAVNDVSIAFRWGSSGIIETFGIWGQRVEELASKWVIGEAIRQADSPFISPGPFERDNSRWISRLMVPRFIKNERSVYSSSAGIRCIFGESRVKSRDETVPAL